MGITAVAKYLKIHVQKILFLTVRYPSLPMRLITSDVKTRLFITIVEGAVITVDADGMTEERKRF